MAAHSPPAAPRRAGAADRDGLLAWAFLLPPAAYLAALVAVPAVLTVLAAFSVTVGAGARSGAGTGAVTAVLRSAVFWRALGNTLVVTVVATVLSVTFGTVVACLLRARFRGRWPVRFAVLLPWTTPAALSATSWRWLLDRPGSAAVRVLHGTGLLPAGTAWDARPAAATAVAAMVQGWRMTPVAAVIVLAGLAAIPPAVGDAARLDGAGAWRRAFGVTIPLTLPAMGLAALVTALAGATGMTVTYVLTGGRPHGTTQTLPALAYATGVEGGAPTRGAAIAVLLLPVPLLLLFAWSRVRRRLRPPLRPPLRRPRGRAAAARPDAAASRAGRRPAPPGPRHDRRGGRRGHRDGDRGGRDAAGGDRSGGGRTASAGTAGHDPMGRTAGGYPGDAADRGHHAGMEESPGRASGKARRGGGRRTRRDRGGRRGGDPGSAPSGGRR